jgi:hypothetical protein
MHSLKDELGRLFFIGIGVFLFILFFQPFPLAMLDYNSRLLFVTGFGGITFFSECLVFILLPVLLPKWFKISEWESGPPVLLSLLLLVLTATAFAFYIRFVGRVEISLYIMFKVILVCLIPGIILIILYKNKSLERIILVLQEQNKYYLEQISESDKSSVDEEIDIVSDNKSDKLTVKYRDIILIKSADNYIEVYYLEEGLAVKKLLRNTLKNIELQLASRKCFMRCHRTCIVNTMFIEKLVRGYGGYSLKINELDEKISVSRPYLIKMKESLSDL